MLKRKILFTLILSATLIYIVKAPLVSAQEATSKSTQMSEGHSHQDVKRSIPILQYSTPEEIDTGVKIKSSSLRMMSASSEPKAYNLIPNSSVENSSNSNMPDGWRKGGYGTNTRVFSYPVAGYNSSRAIKVELTSYSTGDAKWYFDDIPIAGGKTYEFSNYYVSNIPSIVVMRFTLDDGSYIYKDIAFPESSSEYKKITAKFIAPANAKSATVFHVIKQVGYLITDEFKISESLPEQVDNNLIINGNFENSGSPGYPLNWKKGGWGNNTRIFTYPSVSHDGSKAVKVEMTSRISGDAKWYFDPVPVTPGIYTYSDDFKSDIQSVITVQYLKNDGTYTYSDVAIYPASPVFKKAKVNFNVPEGVQKISIFHLIQDKGYLEIDNASLVPKPRPTTGIFSTGAVSFRFDDGWLSQYEHAVPKLNSVGFKGTFYIISKRFRDDGYINNISREELKEMFEDGHEIGSHTRSHPYLSTFSLDDQRTEIDGSRDELLSLGVGPIDSFAYPFGDYSADTLQIVKDAGYTNAVSTISGDNLPINDKYQLFRKEVQVSDSTTVEQIKAWVDEAIEDKNWLILSFHHLDDSGGSGGESYNIKPEYFSDVVDYIASKNIPVVTVSEGASYVE